jgi:membrane fusion protein (multidrug efflux system)
MSSFSNAELKPVVTTAADQRPTGRGSGTAARVVLVVLGLALATIVAIGGWRMLDASNQRTDDASVFAEIVPLSARASGQVARVLVAPDQPVKAGDVVIELDDRLAANLVKQAEAEWAMAQTAARSAALDVKITKAQATGEQRSLRAALAVTRREIDRADTAIAAADADATRASREAEQSALELDRLERLHAAGMIPQSTLDGSRLSRDVARSAEQRAAALVANARNEKQRSIHRVEEAEGRLDQAAAGGARIAAAEAAADLAGVRVTAAERAVDRARINLSFMKVVAPQEGVVSRLTARVGQYVQEGQPLFHLVPHNVTVIANFKETQIDRIRPGQRATVYVDAFPRRPLTGTVVSVSGGTGATFALLPPNNASGNFVKVVQRVPVRIALDGPHTLQAGLSVEVVVRTR